MLRYSTEVLQGFGMPPGTLGWLLLFRFGVPHISPRMIVRGICGGWPNTDGEWDTIMTALRRCAISQRTRCMDPWPSKKDGSDWAHTEAF